LSYLRFLQYINPNDPRMAANGHRDIYSWMAAGAISILSTGLVVALGARPLDPTTAAGVFPFWWSQSRSVEAAASVGAIRGSGSLPFIVVVTRPEGDVAAKLAQAGALFSIDATGMRSCGT
jgi:hypothetical protein